MKKFLTGRTMLRKFRGVVAEEYNVLMSYGDDDLMVDDDRIRALLKVRLQEEFGSFWTMVLIKIAVELIKFWLEGGFEEAPPTPVEGEP